ncbi:MAG: lipid-A-disaccharide synthase [Planctomycetota bacterium]
MRIFFSVGEPSGDLHGSNLIRHLKSQSFVQDGRPAQIECVGFGGPKMEAAGCHLHYDLTTLAVMFFWQALKNLRFFFKLIGQADQYFAENEVDAVVLIDYPGFNWWIARKAKKHGIPVFYYGVPQMWAWAPWRIKKIKRFVDHVICKLPFEAKWFQDRGCNATYVGHPYFDQIEHQELDSEFLEQMSSDTGPLLTLLPGSRDQEVESVLPILLDAAAEVLETLPNCRVAVASYNQKQLEVAQEQISQLNQELPIDVFVDRTPELMQTADVCLACSGSVSLELMHYRKPTIIVFKVRRWMMWAQSIMLNAKYITLVNLMATNDIRKTTWNAYDPDAPDAEETVMPEYLTTGNPSSSVAKRAIELLSDNAKRNQAIYRLDELAQKYARPGATRRAGDYLATQLGLTAVPTGDEFENQSARKSA